MNIEINTSDIINQNKKEWEAPVLYDLTISETEAKGSFASDSFSPDTGVS